MIKKVEIRPVEEDHTVNYGNLGCAMARTVYLISERECTKLIPVVVSFEDMLEVLKKVYRRTVTLADIKSFRTLPFMREELRNTYHLDIFTVATGVVTMQTDVTQALIKANEPFSQAAISSIVSDYNDPAIGLLDDEFDNFF